MIDLSRNASRRAFERAAKSYDQAAVLQREIADRLLDRLQYLKEFSPVQVLDLGCGTGYCLTRLAQAFPNADTVGIDFAHPMLAIAAQINKSHQTLCAEAELLPLPDNSIDFVLSNLTLQWCDPVSVFEECFRVLRPGGLFMFTTFGPDTLKELRQAWTSVDKHPHVHDFVDLHVMGDLLVHTQFQDPVMDMEMLTMTYNDVFSMLRDLKDIGANNVATNRERGLMGKTRFNKFRAAYETQRVHNKIPATYEVVYGHAWVPADKAKRVPASQNTRVVPVDQIKRSRS